MLDIFLRDMLGWTVLNQLKQHRHPPHSSAGHQRGRRETARIGTRRFQLLDQTRYDRRIEEGLRSGSGLRSIPHRRLLVVEDNEIERQSIVELLDNAGVEIATAGSGAETWDALHAQRFDCIVLDLRLPDISGFELLERIRQDAELRDLPIVVFTGKDLTEEDEIRLIQMAESVVLKGVQSPERLLDETALFLHLLASELPTNKREMLERLRNPTKLCAAEKCLWWTMMCGTSLL